MEKQRIEKSIEKQKLNMLQQKRLEQTIENLDEKMRRETEQMLRKQMMSEEKRHQFEEMRNLDLKKKNEEGLKKQEEIQKTLNRCKELEEFKIYEFNRKMEEVEKQKKIMEKIREEELIQRQIEVKNRELKIIQCRQEKERIDNYKKDAVIAKINETELKIQNMQQAKEAEIMHIHEKNILHRTEKEMNIKRIENMKEYERQKQIERLDEEYRKAEEFRQQKFLIAAEKKEINMQIAIQKKNMVNKLEVYIGKNKEITVKIKKQNNFYLKF
jgi:trichohyalin